MIRTNNVTANDNVYLNDHCHIDTKAKEIKNLKQLYSISAQIHRISIENVQWNIKSAIKVMNRYADEELLKRIFYWYDSYNTVTPRFFMSTLIDYLNENFNEYKK